MVDLPIKEIWGAVKSILESIPQQYRVSAGAVLITGGLGWALCSDKLCYPPLCQSRTLYGYYGELDSGGQSVNRATFTFHHWNSSDARTATATWREHSKNRGELDREGQFVGFRSMGYLVLDYVSKNANSDNEVPGIGTIFVAQSGDDLVGYAVLYDPLFVSANQSGRVELCPFILSDHIVYKDYQKEWEKLKEACVPLTLTAFSPMASQE